MPDMGQQQAQVSQLTDNQLQQELLRPSNIVPQYMVMAEMMKRQRMRQGTPSPQDANGPTVMQQMSMGQPQQAPAQAFDDGGAVEGDGFGGDIVPPQAQGVGIPALSMGAGQGLYGAPTMNQVAQYQQAALQGIGPAPGAMQQYLQNAQGMITDPSQAYNEPIQQIRDQLARSQKQGVNNAMIQAGLAMMAAPGANLLSGLGAGGLAGFNAYQKSQDAQNQVRTQLQNAIISQANSKSQNQQALVSLASGQRGQDISLYDSRMNNTGANAREVAQAGLTGAQIGESDQSNQRTVQAQLADTKARVAAEIYAANSSAGSAANAQTQENARAHERNQLEFGDNPGDVKTQRTIASLYNANIKNVGRNMKLPDPQSGVLGYRQYTSDDAYSDAVRAANGLLGQSIAPPGASNPTANPGKRPPLTAFMK